MSRRTILDWRRAVFASKSAEMTSSVKVLLLYLADHMRERDRHVSLPRVKIAKDLGVHEQRVAERYVKAVKAGFLVSVSAGYTGRTAVYQGTWPDDCVPQTRTQSDPPFAVHSPDPAKRESAGLCTAPQDANRTADLYGTTAQGKDGSDEGSRPTPAVARPTGCQWHDTQACPADCVNHPASRRRSA